MKILLERNDVNREKPNEHSQTPIGGVAETLIEWLEGLEREQISTLKEDIYGKPHDKLSDRPKHNLEDKHDLQQPTQRQKQH